MFILGYNATPTRVNLLAMKHPFWNIEFTPARQDAVDEFSEDLEVESAGKPTHILAYYSLVGRRIDHPDSVIPLTLSSWNRHHLYGY